MHRARRIRSKMSGEASRGSVSIQLPDKHEHRANDNETSVHRAVSKLCARLFHCKRGVALQSLGSIPGPDPLHCIHGLMIDGLDQRRIPRLWSQIPHCTVCSPWLDWSAVFRQNLSLCSFEVTAHFAPRDRPVPETSSP